MVGLCTCYLDRIFHIPSYACISITISTLSSISRSDQHRFGHFHADSSLPRPVSSTRSSFRGHGKEAFRQTIPPLALQCSFLFNFLYYSFSNLCNTLFCNFQQVALKPMSMNQSSTVRRIDPKQFCRNIT